MEHKVDFVGPLVPQEPQTYQDPLIHPVPKTPKAPKEASLAEGLKDTSEGGTQGKANLSNRINQVKGVAPKCQMCHSLQIVQQKVSNSVQLRTILKE